MEIHISSFAEAKEIFGPSCILKLQKESTCQDLIEKLINKLSQNEAKQKKIKELLTHCRFALGDELISLDKKLVENKTFYILPPPSGG